MLRILPHPLPHWNDRPKGLKVDTVVIHSIYSEECKDSFDTEACIELLERHQVASHYLIDRAGRILQFVEEDKRAKHAGESRMPFKDDQREAVNDFSIGIELTGTEASGFTEEQYCGLASLIADIMERHPITAVVGHEHIAPARKVDPGPLFDWEKLRRGLNEKEVDISKVRFGGGNA